MLRLAGHADADIPAAVADVAGRRIVSTAQKELGVTVPDDLGPLIVWVPVLHLWQILKNTADGKLSGADGADLFRQIRYGAASVCQLVRQNMNRNRQFSVFPMAVRVSYQLDEDEAHEQGREKIKGGILVGGNAEISAFSSSRQGQVNFVMAGHLTDQRALKNLKPGSQASDYAASDIIGCAEKQVVWSFGRMGDGQHFKHAVNLRFRTQGQQFIANFAKKLH